MRFEGLEEPNEKELVTQLSSNEDVSLRIKSVPSFCAAALKSWTGASPY